MAEGIELCWLTVICHALQELFLELRGDRPLWHVLGPCLSRKTLLPKSHRVNVPSLRVTFA